MTRGRPGHARRAVQWSELVRQVGQGHLDAFAELYDETSPVVYGVALSIMRSPQLADVVTQEVYAEAWQTAACYDPSKGSVLIWLTSMAHRHVVDRVRAMSSESVPERHAVLNGEREFDRVPQNGESRLDAEGARKALPLTRSGPPRGADAGLIRRLQPDGGGADPGTSSGHGEEDNSGRPGRPARGHGGEVVSDVHSAVGSYAVDALNPVERAEFEAHLDNCRSCQSEVAEFADTLGELNLLVSTTPPTALRESVLAAVGGLAQVRPQRASWSANVVGQPDRDGVQAAPRRASRAPVTEIRPREPHEVAPLEEHPSVVPDTPWIGVAAALSEDMGRHSRRRGRILAALVAILLIVALVLGGWVYASRQQLRAEAVEEQQEVEVLTASDVKVLTSRADRAAVSYVVSRQRDHVLFLGNNLPVPDQGSTYQLWVLKGKVATSGGLVREGGDVRQLLTAPVGNADGLALSLEPAPQGSTTPGSPFLFKVSLPSS